MNNPSAFPYTQIQGSMTYTGMTLRDYMAAKAMQGMMVDVYIPDCNHISKTAYTMADAMMKERET